jgi:hypothetical protein
LGNDSPSFDDYKAFDIVYLAPSPLSCAHDKVDVFVNTFHDGSNGVDDLFDFYKYVDKLGLDFNVNDVICKIKFKHLHSVVDTCSVCKYLVSSNIHQFHHSFGYLNLSPKIVPIASHIIVQNFRELSQGFHDPQIFDLIQYGFPLDLDKSSFLPNLAVTNHGTALQFPVAVDTYVNTEISFGSIFGPFLKPPLLGFHCSPLMTAPKEGGKRRIIVDLSFPSPQNHAVNLSVSKYSYAGTPFILKLPTKSSHSRQKYQNFQGGLG